MIVGELRQFRGAVWSATCAPLGAGSFGIILGEGGGDEGRDDAAATLAGMGQHVAHKVNAAALPGSVQHLGDCGLDAFMGIRDDQFDAAQTAAGELTQKSFQNVLGLRRADLPYPAPRACRRLFTPTAMITATETMRPLLTHLHDMSHPARDRASRPRCGRSRKVLHLVVDLFAQAADLALGDATHAQRLDQIVN